MKKGCSLRTARANRILIVTIPHGYLMTAIMHNDDDDDDSDDDDEDDKVEGDNDVGQPSSSANI